MAVDLAGEAEGAEEEAQEVVVAHQEEDHLAEEEADFDQSVCNPEFKASQIGSTYFKHSILYFNQFCS